MLNALKFLVPTVCAAFVLTGCAMYQPTGAWGMAYENAFLSTCEMRARVAYCSCMLGYLERNVSVGQVSYDGNAVGAGGAVPEYVRTGASQCQWAVL